MTNFQKGLIKSLLLGDFNQALKLRKQYTKSFDKAFETCFGKSFGVELEISFTLLKGKRTISKIDNKLSYYRTLINKESTVYTMLIHQDGPCIEASVPVYAKTLHIFNKFLNEYKKEFAFTIDTSREHSSSMHIHTYFPQNKLKELKLNNIHEFTIEYLIENYSSKLMKLWRTDVHNISVVGRLLSTFTNVYCHNRLMEPVLIKGNYNSIESRWYHGTFDIQKILLRAMFIYGFSVFLETQNTTALELALEILDKKYPI